MIIESVVDSDNNGDSHGLRDEMCSACQMAVVWMQNQLRRNQTEEKILDYINQVELTVFCRLPFVLLSFVLKA